MLLGVMFRGLIIYRKILAFNHWLPNIHNCSLSRLYGNYGNYPAEDYNYRNNKSKVTLTTATTKVSRHKTSKTTQHKTRRIEGIKNTQHNGSIIRERVNRSQSFLYCEARGVEAWHHFIGLGKTPEAILFRLRPQ